MSNENIEPMDSVTRSMVQLACIGPQFSMRSESASSLTQDATTSIKADAGVCVAPPTASPRSSCLINALVQEEFPIQASAQKSMEMIETGSKPLAQFHPFPRLPTELRLKVYHIAMQEPRLIEIERVRKDPYFIRVVSDSRIPPALFHLCQESRAEASTIYEKRVLQSPENFLEDKHEIPYIWYNAAVDIILFGDKCGDDAMIALFSLDERPIPRVAVTMKHKTIIEVLEVLHGTPMAKSWVPYSQSGCLCLEEVFIIVESKLRNGETRKNGRGISLRPATSSGFTGDVTATQRTFERCIATRKDPRSRVYRHFDKWHGDKWPVFNFVGVTPAMDNDAEFTIV